MSIDLAQLTKLLMMTTSDNDNEALVAMRKANSLLRFNKQTWMDVFKTGATPKPRRTATPSWEDFDATSAWDYTTYYADGTTRTERPKAKPRGRNSGVSWNGRLLNDHDIEMMFVMALQNVRRGTSFYDTLVKIREFWHAKGFITQKQFDVVARAAEQ